MDKENQIAEILRPVDFDLNRLSESERTRVFGLAHAAWLEIWCPGVRWPSSEGAGSSGGEVTQIEARGP